MLHPDIEARKSPVEGVGLIATANLPEGSVVLTLDPDVVPMTLEEMRALPPVVQRRTYAYRNHTYILTTDGPEWINHGCDPNTWWENDETLVASREIHRGEEVTFDYGTSEASPWFGTPEWSCQCGAASCRGAVTGRD